MLDKASLITLLIAAAPVAGLTAALAYAFVWRSYVALGDLDLSATAIVASAGSILAMFAGGAMFGALTVAVARRAWTFVPAFMVSFTLSALYLIVPTAAFLTSQAGDDMGFQWVWFTLVGLVAGGGVAVWVRRQRVPLTKHAIRRKGPLVVLTCASLLVAAAILSSLPSRKAIVTGQALHVNILPFAGGTVRYVRLVPQVAELEGLRNVECAVAFGANSSGDRAIRLVRQVGKVKVTELWFINPQMVSVFESPACDEGLRKLVWGPTTYVSPLTPLPDSPAATSTTAPSTDPAPTSTTVAG